jgi:hypothetical protein
VKLPLGTTLLITSTADPALVSVTVCGSLVRPVNDKLAGERPTGEVAGVVGVVGVEGPDDEPPQAEPITATRHADSVMAIVFNLFGRMRGSVP